MKRLAVSLVLAIPLLFQGRAFGLDLIKEGKPVSAIVIPDKATVIEQDGAQTLVRYFKQSSGAELPVVAESKRPQGTIVSVGATNMAKEAGINAEGLKFDGYRLVVKGGNLYLFGRDTSFIQENIRAGAQGSIRAAFGLLDRLGFRWLQPTPAGTYVPQLKTISVADDLNVTYQPPFMYVHGRMYTLGDWSMANSFRKAVKLYSQGGHTWDVAVPTSLYKTHPEYFRMQGGVRIEPRGEDKLLCASNPDVLRMITEYTLKKFDEGYDIVALGQPDGWTACECPACQAMGKGDEANEQVHLTQKKVIEAAYAKYPDRFVHLLVYGPTYTPSKRFKAYPPNTMIEAAGGHEPELIEWQPVAPGGITVYVYYMGTYQDVGMAPKFTPAKASEQLRRLLSHNVKGIYFCGGGENWGAEGPTYYTIGRIATDPTQDWRTLLSEYCRLTFGKAGETMRQYFDLLYTRIDMYQRSSYGPKDGPDDFTAVYTPEALEQMGNMLTLAKKQAEGDVHATNMVHVSQISYDHFAGIARVYHLYQAYEINPTLSNLAQVGDAVKAYHDYVDNLKTLPVKEPVFVRDYFPCADPWISDNVSWGLLKTNIATLTSPFTWDFDKLLKNGILPGKTRAKAVVTRLKEAPVIDGNVDKPAWKDVPWNDMPEPTLRKTEASARVRLGYDDKNLYVAFECAEPRIDEMVVKDFGHDGKVWGTECVEVFLAPDGNGQKHMQICLNPSKEGRWEGRYGYIDDPLNPLNLSGDADISWNPKFQSAYKIDPAAKKWTMEIAFPFDQLGVTTPADGTRWRGNLGRERHKGTWSPKYDLYTDHELFLWSPNLQGGTFTDPAAFGDLYFGSIPADTKR